MSAAMGGTGPLGGLEKRLANGIGASARRARPDDWQFRDENLADLWPGQAFEALAHIREHPWKDPDGPRGAIERLASELRAQRPLLATVLFSPDTVLGQLLGSCGSAATGLVDSWMGLFWIAEAAWAVISESPPADTAYTVADTGMLRPLAARLRFLVASEPSRTRGHGTDSWWGGAGLSFSGSGILDRALGNRSWGLLVARSQEARREWLHCLDSYQSHPLLAQATQDEFENELWALAFRRGHFASPLGLSVRPLNQNAPLTAEDKTVLDEVTDRHLLPRFDVASTVTVATYDHRSGYLATRAAAGILVALAGMTAAVCAGLLLVRLATLIAIGCYALIVMGVWVFGPGWAAPWLLRFPAASAVGVIALISLSPGGWITAPPGGWHAVLALVIASLGYLIVEARNHGVAGLALLWRSLAVAVIGTVHALMVSLIGLVLVAPAFVQDGQAITGLWHHPGYGRAGMAIALAAAWCLTVGVFSQILWDDRPITAPLAHLSWRAR